MGTIRRGLLNQTAQYYEFDPTLGENGDFKTAVTLTYVRYEVNSSLMYGTNGMTIKGASWLIYDNVTSSPTGIIFKEQDELVLTDFDATKRFAVVAPSSLESSYAHHQEVMLQ